MNYEVVYQTLKAKLKALVPNAAVHLRTERPAEKTILDIDVSVTEVDSTIYTEVSTKLDLSINLLLSVPVKDGTERIHHIASKLVTVFDPLQKGSFWAGEHFVRISSAGQRQLNITDSRYQINVRILAIIYT